MFEDRYKNRGTLVNSKNAGFSASSASPPVSERKFFTGRDLWVVLFLFLALSSFYFFSAYGVAEGKRYAEVAVNGQVDQRVPLSEDGLYSPSGLPNVEIAVREGRAGFVRSDCPDKICVHMGFLSLPGQSAVCLPNRVVLRVVADEGNGKKEKEEALDSVTY
jgi:hypothetical protein